MPFTRRRQNNLAHDVVQFVKGYHGHMHAFGENLSMRYRTGLGLKLTVHQAKTLSRKSGPGLRQNHEQRFSNQPAGLE
jgi:hypothetical protein